MLANESNLTKIFLACSHKYERIKITIVTWLDVSSKGARKIKKYKNEV